MKNYIIKSAALCLLGVTALGVNAGNTWADRMVKRAVILLLLLKKHRLLVSLQLLQQVRPLQNRQHKILLCWQMKRQLFCKKHSVSLRLVLKRLRI